MMERDIAAMYDDFESGTSTIVYTDGSREISGPDGTKFIPAPGKLEIIDRNKDEDQR